MLFKMVCADNGIFVGYKKRVVHLVLDYLNPIIVQRELCTRKPAWQNFKNFTKTLPKYILPEETNFLSVSFVVLLDTTYTTAIRIHFWLLGAEDCCRLSSAKISLIQKKKNTIILYIKNTLIN